MRRTHVMIISIALFGALTACQNYKREKGLEGPLKIRMASLDLVDGKSVTYRILISNDSKTDVFIQGKPDFRVDLIGCLNQQPCWWFSRTQGSRRSQNHPEINITADTVGQLFLKQMESHVENGTIVLDAKELTELSLSFKWTGKIIDNESVEIKILELTSQLELSK